MEGIDQRRECFQITQKEMKQSEKQDSGLRKFFHRANQKNFDMHSLYSENTQRSLRPEEQKEYFAAQDEARQQWSQFYQNEAELHDGFEFFGKNKNFFE